MFIKSKNWVKKYSRVGNIQFDELVRARALVYNPYFPKIIKSFIVLPARNGFTDGYYKNNEWHKLMQKIAQYVTKSNNFLSEHKMHYKDKIREYLRSTNPFQKELSNLPNKQFLKLYKNYVQKTKACFLLFYTPWAINEIIEPNFIKEIKNRYKEADFIINSVSSLSKETRFNKQLRELAWLKLKGRLKGKTLTEHVKKWGYLNIYAPQQEPFKSTDFIAMAKDLNIKKINKFNTNIKQNRQNFKKALCLLKDNKRIRETAKFINHYIYLRTERIDVYREVTSRTKPFYKELDKRLGLDNFESSFMTIEEIEKYLGIGKMPDLKKIRRRAKIEYCWYCVDGHEKIILNKKEIKKIYSKIESEHNRTDKITGKVAQKGDKISGEVKIILATNESKSFKKGQILVTPMTRPEYLPILKKASAIITDEGGITCHAAIVSRELRIPCIIGTKIATKVLKDGDKVEVDATKGVVKKL